MSLMDLFFSDNSRSRILMRASRSGDGMLDGFCGARLGREDCSIQPVSAASEPTCSEEVVRLTFSVYSCI